MRSNYDFSKGVRNQYAKHLGDFVTVKRSKQSKVFDQISNRDLNEHFVEIFDQLYAQQLGYV